MRVVALVRDTLARAPRDTIGILVRSRAHAAEIVRQLQAAQIGFVAPDLEELEEQSVVQDLLALTRALTHLGDRLAWLACLRAPWCGLTLADLHALAAPDLEASIWHRLADPDVLASLEVDARERVDRFTRVMRTGLSRRGAGSLRDLVEHTWLELGGPATVLAEADLEVARSFFDYLGTMEAGGDCVDGGELRQRLAGRPITRSGGDPRVQIMTMHKAKGLEFDTVLLPRLDATTRTSDRPALLFHELTTAAESEPIVVAPIKAATETRDEIFELLWKYQQRKDELERDRLLYVAITRARRRLHLFAGLARDASDGELV
ncbi:MAG: DNA helicase UvrD, partial [Gammaproteobacteria bacterium]|nr:DNA helicase UvrD [Gammaproteobacteria bacterium]